MSETPRDPNAPEHGEWLPDEEPRYERQPEEKPGTTAEPVADQPSASEAPTTANEPAFDQGAIERERNRKAQEAAAAGVAVTHEPERESEDEEYRWHTGQQRPTGQPDAVEFVDVEVPQRLFPPGGTVNEPWPSLYYSNLTANFVDEILDGGETNEGNFADAAWVQEVINAVEISHHDRGWTALPLAR